jgi:hypothetical protein
VHLAVSDRPRLVEWAAMGFDHQANRVDLAVSPTAGGRARSVTENASEVGGCSSGSGYVVQPGESPDLGLSVPGGGTSRTRLALVISDQVH